MSDERVFVSHAPGDVDVVESLFRSVRNLPFDVHVAAEEVEPGRSREHLKGRLNECDVTVVVVTEAAASNQWINQEIGYAVARGVPIVPVFERQGDLGGYLRGIDGVALDRESMDATVFNLLSRLRSELAPLGSLSTPKWYVRFPCNAGSCGEPVTLTIDQRQKELWRLHDHGRTVHADCDECGARYHFDPATLGFLQRETLSQ